MSAAGASAPPATMRRVVLRRRPGGSIELNCFGLDEAAVPAVDDGEFLVEVSYVTIDPAIRGWLNERGSGYVPGVEIDDVVRSSGVGRVVISRAEQYPVGTVVTMITGWQEYVVGRAAPRTPIETASPYPAGTDQILAVTVLANSGFTAYAAAERVLELDSGQSLLVTGAASLVGSIVGQLAVRRGVRVVGTAGSAEKCRWLVDDLGFAAAIDYRNEDLYARLREEFPTGIDRVFDNVGGATLDTVLRKIAVGARVVLCGTVGEDDANERHRMANIDRLMSRRATMIGFNSLDHLDLYGESSDALACGVADGTLVYRTHIRPGLEHAPQALFDLYRDPPIGKALVAVSADL